MGRVIVRLTVFVSACVMLRDMTVLFFESASFLEAPVFLVRMADSSLVIAG